MKQITPRTKLGLIIGAFLTLFIATSTSGWAKPNRNRHRMMEKIETIKMWKLMDALNLDSRTALKVFPIIKEMDQKKADLMRKKRDLTRQIRDQLKGKSAQPEKIDALASQLFDLTEQLCALSREEYTKLKPILTERQLGQFLLFQQRFRRELLNRWVTEKRRSRQDRPFRGKKSPSINY